MAAILAATVTVALAAGAGPVTGAAANLGAVRTDLRSLEARLGIAITRVSARRASPVNLGPIQGALGRALEQFPPVFGRAYAQTFLPLACVESQPARARTCAGALVGVLGASTASHGVRTAARSLRAAANRPGRPRPGRAEAVLIHGFPSVFGLPYSTTFASLSCIESGLIGASALARRGPSSRKVLLVSLRRVNGCAKLLAAELVPIKTGAPSTAPATPTTGGPPPPAPPTAPAPPPVPPGGAIYRDTRYSFAERAADLVSRMTLAEKVAQLRTNSAPAIPRLGVQQYTYWSEGQHGVNALGANTNTGATQAARTPRAFRPISRRP